MVTRTWFLHTGLNFLLAAAVFALITADASAQGIEKFVVTGDAAKKALTRSEISGETAARIAQACFDYATEHRYGAATVVILSPSGSIVHAHRMDGSLPFNIDAAQYKAQAALYMRAGTRFTANRFGPVGRALRQKLNLFLVEGGLPIIVDDQLIGAIGVGGLPVGSEACAYAALTKVLGPQPPLPEGEVVGTAAREREESEGKRR